MHTSWTHKVGGVVVCHLCRIKRYRFKDFRDGRRELKRDMLDQLNKYYVLTTIKVGKSTST